MHYKPAILFVCLGNICRSPLAEAAFRLEAEKAGLDAHTDSAGTAAYHVGSPPDPRSIREAAKHGIDISAYQARQIEQEDFTRFTHIFAMDRSNLSNIRAIAPEVVAARIALLMDVLDGSGGKEVEDPYYGGDHGFAVTWEVVAMAARQLAKELTS